MITHTSAKFRKLENAPKRTFSSNQLNYKNQNESNFYRVDINNNRKSAYVSEQRLDKSSILSLMRKPKKTINANVCGTKFEIVRLAAEASHFNVANDEDFDTNLIWDDTKVSIETISELKSFQHYNHFPAMSEISRKDALARNMMRIARVLPSEFNFTPQTWLLPNDYMNLCSYSADAKKAQQKKTFILKPANAACGHGIRLYRYAEKIQPVDNYIVQEYISRPYLLDGYKFDLRIYVLVTSCDPLRAFIYEDGLVRMGTEKYEDPTESNIDHLYMHLTNYSVNKQNVQNFSKGEAGTKRYIKHLFDHLRENDKDPGKVWREIQDVVLKTLLVAEPYLFHTYKMCRPGQSSSSNSVCFEILGFDILLDEDLKPWVIEVNRSPSFGTDQQIDFDIKSKLLINVFNLVRFRSSDRQRSIALEKAETQRRLYKMNTYISKNEIVESTTLPNSNANLDYITRQKNARLREKKKNELIEQLKQLRREKRRQHYENSRLGRFTRLFPIDDKVKMENYLNILSTAFNLFYPIGKHCIWKKTYERIREDELIDKIAEYDDGAGNDLNSSNPNSAIKYYIDDYSDSESEYNDVDMNDMPDSHDDNKHRNLYSYTGYQNSPTKYHHHVSSQNNTTHDERSSVSTRHNVTSPLSISQSENIQLRKTVDLKKFKYNEDIESELDRTNQSKRSLSLKRKNTLDKFSAKTDIAKGLNTSKNTMNNENLDTTLTHDMSAAQTPKKLDQVDAQTSSDMARTKQMLLFSKFNMLLPAEIEGAVNDTATKFTTAAYKLLAQLEIKFPGKSNEQTRIFLNQMYAQFTDYNQKLANYWMVKLDDTKRSKIIDIVRSNIVVILQKVYMNAQLENLRLYKIFVKLLNRMLWMHGQGLWNCFIDAKNASWEAIFSKSSFTISEMELNCCRRIVDLCKDCVLIVYQYALEQKTALNATKSAASKTTVSTSATVTDDNAGLLRRRRANLLKEIN